MNVTDLLRTYFGDEAAQHLGAAAGLDERSARQVLAAGLPLQLQALADQAGHAEGRALLGEALENLPAFGHVSAALTGPGGATQLHQAGELLAPALLGAANSRMVEAATAASGAAPERVRHLLDLALPLLLSFVGQQAGERDLGSLLSGLRYPGAAEVHLGTEENPGGADLEEPSSGRPVAADRGLTPSSLLDFYKTQFSGENAERIGVAAGIAHGGQRATSAALPLVLDALVHRGRTESGAADILNLARVFLGLSGAGGQLKLGVLADRAALERLEGEGSGLLDGFFGHVDELTGRLETALGGSDRSARRLLSLLLPLVLSVLGRRAQEEDLNAEGLSRLLGDLSGSLAGLLPAGLTGLSALLGRRHLAVVAVPQLVAAGPTTTAVAASMLSPPRQRRGWLWWLIPLLLLLLGGCWLLRPKPTLPPSTQQSRSIPVIAVQGPRVQSSLPSRALSLSGTALKSALTDDQMTP
ncbi:DUF937 domain-containing protein [Deinococcus hohokamensis]|uniref:DUF937 domain-containing protein n=1 Tax=Deinococcus hohokamensis TaxID=309883 RepID=A0ABV9IAI0_9DEIO